MLSASRVVLSAGVLVALLRLVAVPSTAATPSPPPLPPCTTIPVVLVDTLDTAKARTGDVFRFRTIDTILAPGNVRIPGNALGYGVVTYASAAGPHGKGGDMVVEARYVQLPHEQYEVTIDSVASSLVQSGSTGNVSPGVAAVPLPFVGTAIGAFNYFHAGKNAVIRSGSRFVVIPVRDLARGLRCAP